MPGSRKGAAALRVTPTMNVPRLNLFARVLSDFSRKSMLRTPTRLSGYEIAQCAGGSASALESQSWASLMYE
eukprot:5006134-Pyramimonas_sp.AAC.1